MNVPANAGQFAGGERRSRPRGRSRAARVAVGDFVGSALFWRVVMPALDALVLVAAVLVFAFLRLGGEEGPWVLRPQGLTALLIFVACVLVAIGVVGGYRRPEPLRNLGRAAEFLLACGVGVSISLFVIFAVLLGVDVVVVESRAVLLLSALAFVPVALGFRIACGAALKRFGTMRPYLFVGDAEALRDFADVYARSGLTNPVVAACPPGTPHYPGFERIDFSEIPWTDVGREYESVILGGNPAAMDRDILERLVRMHFNEVPVFKQTAFYASMWRQIPTLDVTSDWVFEQNFSLAARSYYRYVKRFADLVISTVLLLVLSPLMVLAALLILVDSGWPVFFRQPRVGRNRRVFTILKFRTMRTGADSGSPYTVARDERITRVGRILRVLRIDELPQLLNVLWGDMSLIGPRPEWTRLAGEYEKKIPYYHFRHLVKPGITGWAQLNFRYGTSLEDAIEKLRYDLYYIQFYSPVLDLEIVFKTFLHVLSFKGR